MGEGAPPMSLGSSPATLERYTATRPTHLVNSRDTVRTDLVNRTTKAEGNEKLLGKAAETRIRGWHGVPRRKYRKPT